MAPKAGPVEPVDVTTIMSDGEVFRKAWGKEEKYLGNLNDGKTK